MYAFLAQYGNLVFIGPYLVGAVLLWGRWAQSEAVYLRHLPPVHGHHLDRYAGRYGGGIPFRSVDRAIRHARNKRQADPVVERSRRKSRWQFWQLALWIIGSPVLYFGVGQLVVAVLPH